MNLVRCLSGVLAVTAASATLFVTTNPAIAAPASGPTDPSSPGELVKGDPAGYASGTVTRMYGGGKGLGAGTAVSGRALGVETQYYGYLAHQ